MTEKNTIDCKKCAAVYEDNRLERSSSSNQTMHYSAYANSHKRHIVIVEDEPGVALCIKLHLNFYFHLKMLTNAEDALTYIKNPQQEINLIILDYQLLGIDGIELISILRKDPTLSYLPIILQTAIDKSLLDPANIKANCFLQKPWTGEDLQNAITRVLGPFL